jgi:hypothetical protein
MQPKIKTKPSIATIFVILSAYGFIFNIERSVAETDLTFQQQMDRVNAQLEHHDVVTRQFKCVFRKTLRTLSEQKSFCEDQFRTDLTNAERKMNRAFANPNAATQDPYTNRANAAARQRYLMDNQTGSIPIMRTGTTSESQKRLDFMDNQIRAERGMAEARRKERNAAACLYRSSECK